VPKRNAPSIIKCVSAEQAVVDRETVQQRASDDRTVRQLSSFPDLFAHPLGEAARRNDHIPLDIKASDSTISKSRSKTIKTLNVLVMAQDVAKRLRESDEHRPRTTRRLHLEIDVMNANRESYRNASSRVIIVSAAGLPTR
jgi:hypothetical protein